MQTGGKKTSCAYMYYIYQENTLKKQIKQMYTYTRLTKTSGNRWQGNKWCVLTNTSIQSILYIFIYMYQYLLNKAKTNSCIHPLMVAVVSPVASAPAPKASAAPRGSAAAPAPRSSCGEFARGAPWVPCLGFCCFSLKGIPTPGRSFPHQQKMGGLPRGSCVSIPRCMCFFFVY